MMAIKLLLRNLLAFLCIFMTLFITGCEEQGTATDHNPIKIGMVVEQTGKMSSVGTTVQNAAKMAVGEVNTQGGLVIRGQKHAVELIIKNDDSTPEGAITATQELVKQKDILAIIGPNISQEAIPAGNVAEESKVLMITPGAVAPEVTMNLETGQYRKYVFRTAFSALFQSQILAKFAWDTRHYKTAAILYDASSKAPSSQAYLFKKDFEKLGGKVIVFESFQDTDKTFDPQLERIKAANPDVLFLPNFDLNMPPILKEIKKMDIQSEILGSDNWNSPEADSPILSNLKKAYYTVHFSVLDPSLETQTFTTKYKQLYKKEPDNNAALAYDTCHMLFETFEAIPKLERTSVRDTLVSLPPVKGITGTIDYSENFGGEPLKGAVILQVQNGKSTWVAYETP